MADPQMKGCGLLTVKYLLFFFNLIFCISGILLIAVGGVAQEFFQQYIQFFESQYETPAITLIILGAITLVVSFFGCCGAKRENVTMLQIFICLMVVIMMCEVAAVIAVAVMRLDIEELVKRNLNKTMDHFGQTKSLSTFAWNDIQLNHRCCGVMSYLDWEKIQYGVEVGGVPDSCCVETNPACGHGIFGSMSSGYDFISNIYTKGCYQVFKDAAISNVGAIGGGIAGLIFFQLLGIFMSSHLIQSVRNYERM
ncbi:CD63 antigen-like [Palaemon carinicauda]|uniref:CD63 antigen-like n=1 Tax=Palaemon carinicauda TaxID=392227 RepID=UPI0035B5B1DA